MWQKYHYIGARWTYSYDKTRTGPKDKYGICNIYVRGNRIQGVFSNKMFKQLKNKFGEVYIKL